VTPAAPVLPTDRPAPAAIPGRPPSHQDSWPSCAPSWTRWSGWTNRFLATNPGLSSRFSHRVRFADYTTDELVTIVNQHAATAGYECTAATVAALRTHFAAVPRGASFGNGRYARLVLDAAITRHATRLRGTPSPTIDDLCLLLPEDVAGAVGPRQGK
jgi:AAA lid domain-containing protein